MTQLDTYQISTTYAPTRCYTDRLARVGYCAPHMLSIVENTVGSGTFNRIFPLGLAAPNAAPTTSDGGAGALTGTYSHIVAFVDSNRAIIGVASSASIALAVSSRQITVSLLSIGNRHLVERATHIYIYRNLTGTSTYHYVASVTKDTLSYTDNSTDAAISANDELDSLKIAHSVNTYGNCITHKNFPFFFGPYNQSGGTWIDSTSGSYDDDFTWGLLAEADHTYATNRTKIDRGRAGHVTAAGGMGDDLAFYKKGAIYVLQFDQNPSGTTGDGYGKTVNSERGCLNGRCLVNVQGLHFVLDQEGIYEHKGFGNIQELGRMHLDALWNRINWAQSHKFCGAWDNDTCVWFVALDGDSECNWAFAFDLKAYRARGEIRWDWKYMHFGVRDCVRFRFGTDSRAVRYGMVGKAVIAVLDTYGYTAYFGAGFRDLVDPQLTGRATVTGGSTSTIVASAATFSRTNEAGDTCSAVGAYGRFVNWEEFAVDKPGSADWSQVYRITGVSGTTLTVSPTMPTTPPSGAIFEVGPIDALLRSPKEAFGAPQMEKVAKRLVMEYQPQGIYQAGSSIARVRFKRDGRGYEVNNTTVSGESNLAQTAGRDHTEIYLGGGIDGGGLGVASVAAPGGSFRYLEYEIDLGGVDNPAIIDALTLEPGP